MRFDLELIKPLLQQHQQQLIARYDDLNLYSAFQPILNINNYDIVGYEGLMRSDKHDGGDSVDGYFDQQRSLVRMVGMDRVLRTLHVANFARQANDEHKLFLNICPLVIIEGRRFGAFFESLLNEYDLPAERVVIEIVEKAIHDEQALSKAVDYYRNIGCQIAIDDFGRGYSNLSRIWSVKPDIVKLDRHLLHFALQQDNSIAMLRGVVDMLHESGSQVVAEGVETRAMADLAYAAGVDMLQGYYYQEPMALITPEYQSQLMPMVSNSG